MGELTICLMQVISSAFCMALFLTTVIYMLVINRCKFNKRTKIVICTLLVSMLLSISASVVTYLDEIEKGICKVYPLAYSILAQQHIVIMIVYAFLVCRMLSVYFKMTLPTQLTPSWKARWARRISGCQNPIVLFYFFLCSCFVWTFQFLIRYDYPTYKLTSGEELIFAGCMTPKFMFELAILVTFIFLLKSFN